MTEREGWKYRPWALDGVKCVRYIGQMCGIKLPPMTEREGWKYRPWALDGVKCVRYIGQMCAVFSSGKYSSVGARPVSYLFVELHLFTCDSDGPLTVSWFVTLLDLSLRHLHSFESVGYAGLTKSTWLACPIWAGVKSVTDPWQDSPGCARFVGDYAW